MWKRVSFMISCIQWTKVSFTACTASNMSWTPTLGKKQRRHFWQWLDWRHRTVLRHICSLWSKHTKSNYACNIKSIITIRIITYDICHNTSHNKWNLSDILCFFGTTETDESQEQSLNKIDIHFPGRERITGVVAHGMTNWKSVPRTNTTGSILQVWIKKPSLGKDENRRKYLRREHIKVVQNMV